MISLSSIFYVTHICMLFLFLSTFSRRHPVVFDNSSHSSIFLIQKVLHCCIYCLYNHYYYCYCSCSEMQWNNNLYLSI